MTSKKILHYPVIFLTYLQVVVVSLLANIALYYVGKQFGGFSEDLMTPNGQTVGLTNVVVATFVFPLIGTFVFTIVSLFSKNPLRLFRILGYTFLLINVIGPLQLENGIVWDKVILEIMHLIVGVGLIEFFVRRFPKLVSTTTVKS
jgi:Family of unknown function (DUF6069)